MKIRFNQNIELPFITGVNEITNEHEIEIEEFKEGDELETFLEQVNGKINIICTLGMADNIPADSFQILSLD